MVADNNKKAGAHLLPFGFLYFPLPFFELEDKGNI